MSITEFLLARIAEDEEAAREAGDADSYEGGDTAWCAGWLGTGIRHLVRNVDVECYESGHEDDPALCGRPARYAGQHIARHDPARVLSECEAKRRIVEDCKDYLLHDEDGMGGELAERTLSRLALPYADHPDYDSEWTP